MPVPGSGRMSKAHYAVKWNAVSPPVTPLSPTLTRNFSVGPSAFPVLLPTGTLALTKEVQSFLLPGALLLPNCGEEFKGVGLCTDLIQGHRKGNGGGKVQEKHGTNPREEWGMAWGSVVMMLHGRTTSPPWRWCSWWRGWCGRWHKARSGWRR